MITALLFLLALFLIVALADTQVRVEGRSHLHVTLGDFIVKKLTFHLLQADELRTDALAATRISLTFICGLIRARHLIFVVTCGLGGGLDLGCSLAAHHLLYLELVRDDLFFQLLLFGSAFIIALNTAVTLPVFVLFLLL